MAGCARLSNARGAAAQRPLGASGPARHLAACVPGLVAARHAKVAARDVQDHALAPPAWQHKGVELGGGLDDAGAEGLRGGGGGGR